MAGAAPSTKWLGGCVALDEKEFINLRLCALDLRNNYAILNDMIIKNLEKLKRPRSSNHMQHMF